MQAADVDGKAWSPSIREYHADAAFSSSSLRQFVRDRYRFYHERILERPKADEWRREFVLGAVVHALLLEDGRGIEVSEEGSRTKAFRAQRLAGDAAGVTVVPSDLMRQATEIAEAVRARPDALQIISRANPAVNTEVSHRWKDAETGLWLKVRFDVVNHSLHAIADLKTSSRPSPGDFRLDYAVLRYDLQCGLYSIAAKKLGLPYDYYYIVVGVDRPHQVFVFRVDSEEQRESMRTTREVLRELASCLQSDDPAVWMQPFEAVNILSQIPDWRTDDTMPVECYRDCGS